MSENNMLNSYDSVSSVKPLSSEELYPSELNSIFIGNYNEEYIQHGKEVDERIKQQEQENIRRSQLAPVEQNMEDFNEAYKQGVRLETENLLKANPKYNQQHVRELMHDLTYIDSLEQHTVDLLDLWITNDPDKDKMMSINEAREYAKEQGVVWNAKDKSSISKYELDKIINRENVRKETQQELAFYMQDHDYTRLNKIGQMASAISGSVGALEIAAYAGLSWLCGAGMAEGLARLAPTLKEAGDIYKGVNLAKKAQLYQKLTNVYKEAGKEVLYANRIQKLKKGIDASQEAIKTENFLTKVGYDAARFYRSGAPGSAASLESTMVPFAIDSAITDIPRELIEMAHSKTFDTGEYEAKDMMRDLLLATGIGAGLPVAGKVIKGISKGGFKMAGATWDVANNAANKVKNEIENRKLEEVVKNRQIIAKALEEESKNIDKSMADIATTLKERNLIPNEIVDAAKQIDESNLTHEEALQVLQQAIDVFTIEGTRSHINSRPAFMSTVGKIYDTLAIADKKGKTIDEAWADLERAGIVKIKRGQSNINSKLDISDVDEAFLRMRDTHYDARGIVQGERGQLGKTPVAALTHSDVNYVIKRLYIANMIPDTELGRLAKQDLTNYFEHIKDVRKRINNVLDTFNQIITLNKNKDLKIANNLLSEVGLDIKTARGNSHSAIPYHLQDKLYPLKDGSKGSIRTAIKEIVEDLLPADIREQLSEYRNLLRIEAQEEKTIGHASKETIDRLNQLSFLKDIEKQVVDFSEGENSIFVIKKEKKYSTGKYLFDNLVPFTHGRSAATGKAKATASARLEYIGNLLDEIVANNEELNNIEKVFQDQLPTVEETVSGTRTVADTIKAEEMIQSSMDALTFEKKIKNNGEKYNRFTTSELQLNNKLEKSPEAQVILSNIVKSLTKRKDNKALISGDNLLKFFNEMNTINNLMKEDFNIVRNTLVEKFKTSEVLNNLLAKPNITEKTLWKIPKAKAEFKKLLIKTLDETINVDKQYSRLLGEATFQKIYNETSDAFEEYLKNNKTEGIKQVLTPHAYNAELNSKEEIAKEILGKKEQADTLNKILDPFLEHLIQSILDRQSNNYEQYTKLLDLMDTFAADPAHIDEAILGKFTMTPIEGKGYSLSVENLSCHANEQSAFLVALDKNDLAAINDGIIPQAIAQNKEFEPLKNWVLNPDNMNSFREAVFDTIAYLKGELSEKEVELFNKKNNSRAYRAAKEYLDIAAKLKNDLFNAGSNKTEIINFFDPIKLKNITYQLHKDMLNSDTSRLLTRLSNKGNTNEKYKYLNKYLSQLLTPLKDTNEFKADTNCILYLFENLDLNSQFKSNKDLNQIRDALLTPGKLEELIFNEEVTHKEVEDCLKEITDGFLGIPGENMGLLHRIKGDLSIKQNVDTMSFKARYLENIEKQLYFKNADVEKETLKTLGFDNFKAMFDNNIGNAKKALAVLTVLGPEPIEYKNTMIQLAKEYAANVVPKTHGYEKATKLQKKLNATWERAVTFNAHNVCGTYTVPANTFMRWTQLVIRTLTSPMLAKAGFKSLSDYNYQLQYLVQAGLAAEGDLGARWRVGSQLFRVFSQDKNLAEQLYMNLTLRSDSIYSMLYNTSLATGERTTKGLNQYAPALLKAEEGSRRYTDFLLNKLFWIEPMTNYNRENAALTTMKAIASFSSAQYKDMPERLQNTLLRFGISEYEWDNIFSKHVVTNAKDYIYEMSGKTVSPELSNYKMFFPQMVEKIPDDILKQMMKDQKLAITDISVQKYRRHLIDKASILINSSADEMTSIPTSRIQGALGLHSLPNSGTNFFANTVMQFQSFGAAINYYQMGRRLAHYSTGDSAFNHLLCELTGHPSSAVNLTQFIAESALIEFFIGEMAKELTGTNRKIINDKGEVQGEVIADKTLEYIGGATGLLNLVLQMFWSGITQAKGQGGGLSVPVSPALSTILQKTEKLVAPFTKSSTEGQRGKAFAGALAENTADILGIPNQPFIKAAWQLLIGDSFREWQYGDRAKAIATQRAHRGYAPSWVRHIAEDMGWINPGDTTIYSKLFE